MSHLNYLAVLAFIALCAVAVSLLFRLRLLSKWKVFLLTDGCIIALYLTWDIWAAKRKAWYFDPHQIVGLKLFGVLPVEELLFFILVPIMVILSYTSLGKITQWIANRR